MNNLCRKRFQLWARYTGASVIAGIISEIVFLVTYWFGAVPLVASLLAFVAGAVPNYLMNRYWAWQRRGRADRTMEILPYAVIVVVTAVIAILVTTAADRWVRDHVAAHAWQIDARRRRVPGDLRGDVRTEIRSLRPVHLRRPRSTYSRIHVRVMTRA